MALKATIVFALTAPMAFASCSSERASAPVNKWVIASSLPPSPVPFTPKPIFIAREQMAGHWVLHPPNTLAKAMNFDRFLNKLVAAKSLNPEPLVLFSFAFHADRSDLTEIKSRIAEAMECSEDTPCIEGTPDQLR